MVIVEASCKTISNLEDSLFNLYWLQKKRIELSIQLSNNLVRYINKTISFSELSANELMLHSEIDKIDEQIELYKNHMNYYIAQREHREKNKPKKSMKGRIKGMTKDTLRRITIDLFDSKLPKECYVCGSKNKLHIHHINYRFPIELSDLKRLCSSCHSKHHKKGMFLTPHPLIADGKYNLN